MNASRMCDGFAVLTLPEISSMNRRMWWVCIGERGLAKKDDMVCSVGLARRAATTAPFILIEAQALSRNDFAGAGACRDWAVGEEGEDRHSTSSKSALMCWD